MANEPDSNQPAMKQATQHQPMAIRDNPHVEAHRLRMERPNERADVDLGAFLGEVGPVAMLQTLAQLLPDAAIFAVDGKRNVISWSEGAERLLGFTADDVIGRYCLHANRCHQCMLGCGIAEYGQVHDVPLVLLRADGTPIPVRKTAKSFRGVDGRFLGGVEVLVADRTAGETRLRAVPTDAVATHGILTRDDATRRALELAELVAPTETTVLIRGEIGTGKELMAHAIHGQSARAEGPMVVVRCGALTPELLAVELFGEVRRGDRHGARPGGPSQASAFERARGGTLFLDEIADIPLDLQEPLLQVLLERRIRPLDGDACDEHEIDVRLIAATRRSLRALVRAGRFREDLMSQVRVQPIFLPPLRDRVGDVELLVWHLIERHNSEARGRRIIRVAPDAMRTLLDYRWPGNVHELEHAIDYAYAVGRGHELAQVDLPAELSRPAHIEGETPLLDKPPSPRDLGPEELRLRVQRALERSGGHIGTACEMLGVSRPTLWRWRKNLGL